MGFEEDTYTTIFKAMQHPIRRRILRMISEKPSTYTEIQRDLNIDNGLLNYHLEALSSLITKDTEEKYTLSDFGRATAGLIKGVEEPSKTIKATSTPPIVKVLIAILTVALIVSAVALLDFNNRYLDLSGKYNTQATEITYMQSSLTASEVSQRKLNATLTTLEKNPLVKASTWIISVVGVDYFNKYFHDPTMQVTSYDANTTKVNYKYRIMVGDYVVDRDVTFYFSPNWVLQYGGIPMDGNLQPFNVSYADAIRLALDAGLPDSPYGYVADIGYMGAKDHPQSSFEQRYLWTVTSWSDPSWARTRTFTYALVDPVTGEVYSINGMGGTGFSESQVDTTAEAKAQGIDGYVKLQYSELPQQIQIVKGGNFTFMIRASFTSYNSSRQEVKLIVDPHYVDPYQIQSNMSDQLRNYLSYAPNGTITIRAGESVNITATIRAPDNVGPVFFFPRWAIDGLGIGADNMLILSDLEA